MAPLHIIMPVKDSIQTATQAIRAIINSSFTLTVYNDFSTADNTQILTALASELHFQLINLSDLTTTPSPNYRLVLQHAEQTALSQNAHLLIIESDVIISEHTIPLLRKAVSNHPTAGLIAAVTQDQSNQINYPYQFVTNELKQLNQIHQPNQLKQPNQLNSPFSTSLTLPTTKHLSFCCTLLTNSFLQAFSFLSLDPTKNWYDVTISHRSTELGFQNFLMPYNRVLHLPHSSRPWKKLKYTNPLLYYWRKLTHPQDKI